MDPRHVHLIAAKNVLRHLKGTVDYGLKYDANQKINLEGYVDSDWDGCEYYAFLMSRSDISVEEDLHGG